LGGVRKKNFVKVEASTFIKVIPVISFGLDAIIGGIDDEGRRSLLVGERGIIGGVDTFVLSRPEPAQDLDRRYGICYTLERRV
jgi:hypothetical protein